jgi:hydantoinase/carbamoylase family amidase
MVTSGSHVDTVPGGGRFDGALGTVLAIEAAQALSGPFGVLVCAAEEGARFGAGTLGSRTLTGQLSEEDLREMRDASGVSVAEAREGFLRLLSDVARLEEADPLSLVAGHVEVHVEQRLELKARGASLGVATAMAGPRRYDLRLTGVTAHSGETLMETRHDALCAAAEIVLLVERLAREAGTMVGTVGRMEVRPNSLTSVPGQVTLGVELRGTDAGKVERVTSRLFEEGELAASVRGVGTSIRELSVAKPTRLDDRLVALVERTCEGLGIPTARCETFASHDVQHLSEKVPAVMLFVPSLNGASHAPDEEVDWKDVESASRALAGLLPELLRFPQTEEEHHE